MKAEAQALKGHLDVLLLAVLEDGPRHGYAVEEALREASGGRLILALTQIEIGVIHAVPA